MCKRHHQHPGNKRKQKRGKKTFLELACISFIAEICLLEFKVDEFNLYLKLTPHFI